MIDKMFRSVQNSNGAPPKRLADAGQGARIHTPEDTVSALHAQIAHLRREQREAERAISELTDDVAARDMLLATAGHELRNPMGAILVSVTNLAFLARRNGDLPEWVHARLRALERQARSFVRRATVLLDASRLSTGAASLSPESLNLSDLVRDVFGELSSEAEKAGCDVRLTLEEGVVGTWDRAAVEQIVLNLLSNAIKYGPGRPVEVSVSGEGARAVIRVRDQGIGIAEADRARIFERFERAGATCERPGFGLGLWISRHLALAHGGDISVASELGEGSVFTAALPRG